MAKSRLHGSAELPPPSRAVLFLRFSVSVNGKLVVYKGYSREGRIVIENVP
jgi:hypothetical protein